MAIDLTEFRIGDSVYLVDVPVIDDFDYMALNPGRITAIEKFVGESDPLGRTSGQYYWRVLLSDNSTSILWDDLLHAVSESERTITLNGLFGDPMQSLIDMLEASDTFSAFSPGQDIYIHSRIPETIESGDTWAELGYAPSGAVLTRGVDGLGSAVFDQKRTLELNIVQAIDTETEDAKSYIVNVAGGIIADIMSHEKAYFIDPIVLKGFGIERRTTPIQIGATLRITL